MSWPSHAAIALTSPASLTETLDYGAGSTACLFSILVQRTHYPVELTTIHFNIYDLKTQQFKMPPKETNINWTLRNLGTD